MSNNMDDWKNAIEKIHSISPLVDAPTLSKIVDGLARSKPMTTDSFKVSRKKPSKWEDDFDQILDTFDWDDDLSPLQPIVEKKSKTLTPKPPTIIGDATVFATIEKLSFMLFNRSHFTTNYVDGSSVIILQHVDVIPIYIQSWVGNGIGERPSTLYSAYTGPERPLKHVPYSIKKENCFTYLNVSTLIEGSVRPIVTNAVLIKFPEPVNDNGIVSLGFIMKNTDLPHQR